MANKSVRWAFNFAKWNPSEAEMLLATSCIQREEKERLAKFAFKKDFKSSLIGRLMMRKFVHETTLVPYNKIQFDRDEKGKPFVNFPKSNEVKLAFNVSHQGNYVVFAGEIEENLIGVDVMKFECSGVKNLQEYFRIMRKTFSDVEWAEIKSSGNDSQQIAMFCRHWCLKESYVKATGVGITINLQDICFKINTRLLKINTLITDTEIFVDYVKQNWLFQESLLDDEHCVAVALQKDDGVNSESNSLFVHIDFSTLTDSAIPLLEFDKSYCELFSKKL